MRTDESPREKLRHALNPKHLKRAVSFVWQSAPKWTAANIVLTVVQGVLPLLLLYVMKLMVDSVTAAVSAPDKGEAFGQVALYIALAGIVTLFSALCGSIAGLVRLQQTQVLADRMDNILHTKSVEVDLEYYETPKYYDTLHRAQGEGSHRPNSIVNGLVQTAQSGISFAAMAGLLLSFHWIVTAILFVVVIPGILVHLKFAGKMYHLQRRWTPSERRASYFQWILTGNIYAKELRLFGLGSLLIDRYRRLRRRLRKERLGIATKRSVADLGAQIVVAIAVFGSFAFIAYRTVHGVITLGDMVMFYGAFQRGLGSLQQIFGGLAGLYENNLFLSNLYEFLDLKPKVIEPANPRPFPKLIKRGIVFDHVSFRYPDNGNKVLDNLSFAIKPGETVALVGENGSGKTTLIKLLCRLYDPREGAITLDGTDLRLFQTSVLRSEISVVFQDYVHYYLSVRENIWFGNLDLPADHRGIIDAAQNSGADDVVRKLKHGYDTLLGRWFEDGEELSIGEWQKVALARAFLRNAQIVVLDEPTSAMDAKTEYEVFKKFRQLADGRTVVLISHRFSTVRMANRILVLEGGKIVESGSHDELIRRGGKYASLYDKQAQHYR